MFKEQPKSLIYIFFTEMWERFSYYGMRALMTLYMVNELFKSIQNKEEIAYGIYAAYGALVYATPLLGGYIADKILGYRKSVILGAILMSIGHFTLALQHNLPYFFGLGFLIVGNGFFKPNMSSLLGSFYTENDKSRDSGFTIFYMGVNLGAVLSPFVCGWLAKVYGWHYGFGAAGIGMLIGLAVFLTGIKRNIFLDKGLPTNVEVLNKKYLGIKFSKILPFLAILFVPVISVLVFHGTLTIPFIGTVESNGELLNILLYVLILPFILFMLLKIIIQSEKVLREKLIAIMIFSSFMTVFFSFFEQVGSSLVLFAERNVNLKLINAAQTNSINPLIIILLAIPVSYMWIKLSAIKKNPYSPIKFVYGFAQLGIAFLIFAFSKNFADDEGKVSMIFLLLGFLFFTSGELFVSPIGLSKVTELSPKKAVGFMVGVFYLSFSFAHNIAGLIAKLTAIKPVDGEMEVYGFKSLEMYTDVFQMIGFTALGFSVIVLLLTPILRKLMHGVH